MVEENANLFRRALRIVGCSNKDCKMYNIDIYAYDVCKGKCPKCGSDLLNPDEPVPPKLIVDEKVEEKSKFSFRCLFGIHDWDRRFRWRKCRRCGQVREYGILLYGNGVSIAQVLPVGVKGYICDWIGGESPPARHWKYGNKR